MIKKLCGAFNSLGLVLLFVCGATNCLAGICNTDIPFPNMALEPGDVASKEALEKWDAFLTKKMSETASREEQVKIYMTASPVKTLKPLADLPNQNQTLDALIKVASDSRPYMGTMKSLHLSAQGVADMRIIKAQAPRLIACFCDKRAGQFLIARLGKIGDARDKMHGVVALGKMNASAEWRADLLGYINTGAPDIDPNNPDDTWAAGAFIKVVEKVGGPQESGALKKFLGHHDARVREDAKRVMEELQKR